MLNQGGAKDQPNEALVKTLKGSVLLPFLLCLMAACTHAWRHPIASSTSTPKPAFFSSAATGIVPLLGIFGDSRSPFQAKHLNLELMKLSDLRAFTTLKASRQVLPSAAIIDDPDGMRYALLGVVVTGTKSAAAVKGHPWIALKFAHFTLKSPSIID